MDGKPDGPGGVDRFDGNDSRDTKEKEMTTDTVLPKEERREKKVIYRNAGSAPVYGLGFIGALVYYIGHAATFWLGVVGFFKAIFWPAFLVYEALKYLSM
jgi:predicted small integral membrane protein